MVDTEIYYKVKLEVSTYVLSLLKDSIRLCYEIGYEFRKESVASV